MLGRLESLDYTVVHPYTERLAFLAFAFGYSPIYLIAQKDIKMSLLNLFFKGYLYLRYFCSSFYKFSKLENHVLLAAELSTTCLQ